LEGKKAPLKDENKQVWCSSVCVCVCVCVCVLVRFVDSTRRLSNWYDFLTVFLLSGLDHFTSLYSSKLVIVWEEQLQILISISMCLFTWNHSGLFHGRYRSLSLSSLSRTDDGGDSEVKDVITLSPSTSLSRVKFG
jgi:hypothetical protein